MTSNEVNTTDDIPMAPLAAIAAAYRARQNLPESDSDDSEEIRRNCEFCYNRVRCYCRGMYGPDDSDSEPVPYTCDPNEGSTTVQAVTEGLPLLEDTTTAYQAGRGASSELITNDTTDSSSTTSAEGITERPTSYIIAEREEIERLKRISETTTTSSVPPSLVDLGKF